MQILSFDSFAVATKDVNAAARLFKNIGFRNVGQLFTDAGEVTSLVQGNIFCALQEGIGSRAHARQFSDRHGEGICELSFVVEQLEPTISHLQKRGAKPTEVRTVVNPRGRGEATSVLYGSLRHTFVQYRPSPRTSASLSNSTALKALSEIDHVTVNVPAGEMEKATRFYTDVLGLVPAAEFDVTNGAVGFKARALKLASHPFSVLLTEPRDDQSKIYEFIKLHGATGISTIAFRTEDIAATVRLFKENNLNFSEPPSPYYDKLGDQIPAISEQLGTFKRLGIMAEGDRSGYLLQAFTKPALGNCIVEVMKRQNSDGFGKDNLARLFASSAL